MGSEREEAAGTGGSGQQPQSPEGEAAAGAAVDQEADFIKKQLEEEKARADRATGNWQRAEADLANFKRRAEQERADLVKFANASLIGRLLPVLDDFERAIGAMPEEVRSMSWVEGIKLIERKLRTLMEQEGVSAIDALGKQFDPHVHEAVLREEGEGDVEEVVEELQKGYKLHDRVLRPAMVKVGRAKRAADQENKG